MLFPLKGSLLIIFLGSVLRRSGIVVSIGIVAKRQEIILLL